MNSHHEHSVQCNFRAARQHLSGPVQYDFGQCSLGSVVVAQSQRGLCAILLGDDESSLHDQLRAALPHATLAAEPSALPQAVDQTIALIEQTRIPGRIELDVGGTPFQQKVWQYLCSIPAGQTSSYSRIAQALAMPKAARAVAGACASNVLAVAIPCHRVVRSDGSITGYRWGITRKHALLAREGAA